jgi:hypothetical protein
MTMPKTKLVGTISQVQEADISSRNVVGLAVTPTPKAKLRIVWYSPILDKMIQSGHNIHIEYIPISLHIPDRDINITLSPSEQVRRRRSAIVVSHEQIRSGLPGAVEIGLDRDILTIEFVADRETCLLNKPSGDMPQMGDLAQIELELVGWSIL